jgi:hypothetical protein
MDEYSSALYLANLIQAQVEAVSLFLLICVPTTNRADTAAMWCRTVPGSCQICTNDSSVMYNMLL